MLSYVGDSVADPTPFGEVRQRAYKIMSRDVLQSAAQRMSVKRPNKLALHWQEVDGLAELKLRQRTELTEIDNGLWAARGAEVGALRFGEDFLQPLMGRKGLLVSVFQPSSFRLRKIGPLLRGPR